ncbi:flagellar L-ring protein precursor FlgH [Crenobacter luteus]|uniref:Flagellar L-ring protein n=1 Tax=Crenobacter luteus TaxID=1452487 RepID=A0A165G6M4_9NEIS|nr:flagellar basal body L-ring protein FlgH [Crenobacter luteus]KZE35262.1 flagellar biosynthesis protein FlgH [Crenobacter luteus]TCP13820.1 flagellar L-ring protein precursor FlgH [Crenobacter luteus]
MKRLAAFFCLVALSACSVPQPPIVQQPMTARPQPRPVAPVSNGAIFQAATYRPLFEDKRPTQVGDTLTVTIEERTTTSSSAETKGSRSASTSSGIDAGINLPFFSNFLENKLAGARFGAEGSVNNNGKGSTSGSSSFNSSITVTVIEVLANGNLVVSGEKQMRLNGDTEFIRLSGVVNPVDVKPGNLVSSTKLADARIEQETEGKQRRYIEPGWLSRFFLSVLPF